MELGNYFFGNSRGEASMPRGVGYEGLLDALLDAIDKEYNESTRGYGFDFENEVFEVHPYWWGDCTCGKGEDVFIDDFEHTEDCKLLRPNFLFKPTGYCISWYKYPLRDSYASDDLTLLEFADIIKKCIESLEVGR